MTVLLCSWPKRKIPLHSLHSRLGGASCKPHFCNVFCSLHDSHLQCISPLEIYLHCTCSLCKKQTNRQTKNTAKVRLAWGPTQTAVWSILWYFPLRKHLLSGLGKTGTFWTLLNGNQFTIMSPNNGDITFTGNLTNRRMKGRVYLQGNRMIL